MPKKVEKNISTADGGIKYIQMMHNKTIDIKYLRPIF